MADTIPAGTWVEIQGEVLAAGERAPNVPDDTARVPLEMRVKGFLVDAASPGEIVQIRSAAGRRLRGTLVAPLPGYSHGFGSPIEALVPIGAEVRALLDARRTRR